MSFNRLDPDELHREPPPVDWLVKNFIACGHLTLMAGEGGLGKSSLALALAAAIAHGDKYYAGFPLPRQAPIAYVDGENSRGEIHRRAKAFGIYEDLYQFDGDMMDSLAQLTEVASRAESGIVVLDSFRSLFPTVEENDTKGVMPALKQVQLIARVENVGILILHHTSKAGVYRGSTEFQNRPDIVTTLKRDTGQRRRYVDWNKMRIGMEPDRHHMSIEQVGGKMTWEEAYSVAPSADWNDWD